MSPAEVLRKAKAEIERRGWWQGSYGPRAEGTDPATCPVCAVGALRAAFHGSPFTPLNENKSEDRVVVDYVRRGAGCRPGILLGDEWNDAPYRTVEEVYKAFDRAIELALAEQEVAK